MKIEKLNNNSYRIRKMYNKKMYTIVTSYKPTQKEAMELMAEKLNSDDAPTKDRMTFEASFKAYINVKSNILSPSTLKGYNSVFNSIPQDFKSKNLSDISQIDIQKIINDYSVEHSPKTVNNMYGLITAVFGLYRPSLTISCTLPQKIKKEPYMPTETDVKRLFEYIKDSKYEVAVKLAALGMRRSEICALTPQDLDGNILTINKAKVQGTDEKWIIKTTKTTDSTREIYLPDELAELIRRNGLYNGHAGAITKYINHAQDELGIPRFGLHRLRHFYASSAHAEGIPDQYIMAAGGWKSTAVLNSVYKHALKDKNENMQKKMADKIKNLY